MEYLLILLIWLLIGYAVTCGQAAPDAPPWRQGPVSLWRSIAPASSRPDYAKIARLERELGMTQTKRPRG